MHVAVTERKKAVGVDSGVLPSNRGSTRLIKGRAGLHDGNGLVRCSTTSTQHPAAAGQWEILNGCTRARGAFGMSLVPSR